MDTYRLHIGGKPGHGPLRVRLHQHCVLHLGPFRRGDSSPSSDAVKPLLASHHRRKSAVCFPPPQKKISSANKPCPLILFCLQTMFMLVSLSLLLFVPMPHTHTHIPHTTHTHHTPHTKLKYSLTHTLCDRYTVYWVLPRFPSLNLVTERYGGAVCRCTEGLRAYTYRDSRCSLNPTTEAATL